MQSFEHFRCNSFYTQNFNNFIQKDVFGNKIKIPNPQTLLKLKKIGIEAKKRDASKRIKDVLDSLALIICFDLKELAKKYELKQYIERYIDTIIKVFKMKKSLILSYF